MTIRFGSTRVVILTRRFAIKLPRLHFCGRCYPACLTWFFGGLHANSIEAARWKKGSREERFKMARVIFGCALFVVMERCGEITEPTDDARRGYFSGISRESEPHNIGLTTDGRVVAIDFAYW